MLSKSKLLVVFSCLLMLGVTARADPPYGSDAPDSSEYAEVIPDGSYGGTITAGDQDWYRIAVPLLQQVRVTMTPDCSQGARDYGLTLYRGNGASVIYHSNAGSCATDEVFCIGNDNQIVFVRVNQVTGTGAYGLTVTTSPTLDGPFCSI